MAYEGLREPDACGIRHALKRGTGRVLRESNKGILIHETVSGAYMLCTEDDEEGREWLEACFEAHCGLFFVNRAALADEAERRFGLKNRLTVFQAVYESDDMPELETKLTIRAARAEDARFVLAHYDAYDEMELTRIVERGELFIGEIEETRVGFVGEHLEGGIGLLHVLPEHRGKGFGAALEAHMIRLYRKRKQTPFCAVETHNNRSLALQKKLGMSVTENPVYWLF